MAYYIGLDLGTSSVGWAVTDENRRTFRVSRRRRQREVARIGLLKDYFHDELANVDPNLNLIRIHLT